MSVVARLRGVRKQRGDFLLDIPELELGSARIHALLGPNGAGKSTLCSLLAGTSQVDAGEIDFSGGAGGSVGYAPQDTGLNLTMTGIENLQFFAALAGFPSRSFAEVTDGLIDGLRLEPFLDKRCRDLSVGQQRQVHVATGLIGPPRLVILDEPTSFMDIHARNRLYLYLDKLVKEQEVAVLYLTHEIREVDRLASECIVINDGTFMFSGRLSDLSESSDDWLVVGPPELTEHAGEVTWREHEDQIVVRTTEADALTLLRDYPTPGELRLSPPGLESEYVWKISRAR